MPANKVQTFINQLFAQFKSQHKMTVCYGTMMCRWAQSVSLYFYSSATQWAHHITFDALPSWLLISFHLFIYLFTNNLIEKFMVWNRFSDFIHTLYNVCTLLPEPNKRTLPCISDIPYPSHSSFHRYFTKEKKNSLSLSPSLRHRYTHDWGAREEEKKNSTKKTWSSQVLFSSKALAIYQLERAQFH